MKDNSVIERHIMSVLVDNEPGVLARVIGPVSYTHLTLPTSDLV